MTDQNNLSGKVSLDSTDFKSGVAAMNREIRVIESGFRASAAALGNWSNSASGLEMRIKALTETISVQEKKVTALRSEYERVAAEKGSTSRAAQELEIKLNNEVAALGKLERELKGVDVALAYMEEESETAGDKVEDLGKKAEDLGKKEEETAEKTNRFASAMGGLGGALKVGVIAVAGLTVAVAGAATMMAKSVIESFGELEQNLGGSEAVFGEYAESIQKSGEEAYKNLGVSQSEYLATANKMGALFQGSGIEQVKSLDLTVEAMQRAADMASVMGIDTQVALDSVAGAAKGNFTMMDNLGVAMNATTIEAYALAKGLDFTWASATNAEKAEVAMQMFFENTEQYAGNFARESTQTITGSLGMLQAAFGSLMGGLGNVNADVANLTGNLVDAFAAVIDNIVPVLGNLVSVLPTAFGVVLDAVVKMLPMLLETVTTLFSQVLTMVVTLLPTLIPVAVDAILTVVDALIENLPMLMSAGMQMFFALIDGILPQLPLLIEMAAQMIVTLVTGIAEALPQLMEQAAQIIPQVIIALVEALPLLIDAALQLLLALIDGFAIALPILIEYTPQIVEAIFNALITSLPLLGEAAVQLVLALIEGIVGMLPQLGTSAVELIDVIVRGIMGLLSKLWEVGGNIVMGIWDGIQKKAAWFESQIKTFFSNIVDSVKNALGIQSPSVVFAGIGENMALGLGVGFQKAFSDVERGVNRAIDGLSVSAPGLSPMAAGAVGGAGSLSLGGVHIYVSGRADPQSIGRAAERGVLRALKSKGMA